MRNSDRARRLDEENVALKRRIAELDISNKVSEEKGKELQDQLLRAQEQILNLESSSSMEYSFQVQTDTVLESAGDEFEVEIMKRDLEDLKDKNTNLEKQLRQLNSTKTQLQSQVDERDKKLKENDDITLDLQRRIQELTIRLEKTGNKLSSPAN